MEALGQARQGVRSLLSRDLGSGEPPQTKNYRCVMMATVYTFDPDGLVSKSFECHGLAIYIVRHS